MSVLETKNITFSYDQHILFEDASMRLFKDDHAVLVGPNGNGKTTFMRFLAKELNPNKGEVSWLPHVKVGYLDQFLSLKNDQLVENYLHDVFDHLFQLEAKMIKLYEDAETDIDPMKLISYASDIQDTLEKENFYQFKSKVDNIVFGLGLSKHVLQQKIHTLSGGMKVKVMLAKLLLQDVDVLLLDEPTNFLDVKHIEFLVNYLNQFKGAFLVISHDEYFMSQIAQTVFAIESRRIEKYKGTYPFYLEQKDLRFAQAEKQFKEQQQLIKKEEAFISKNLTRASTTKRAQSRRKKLEKLTRIDKPHEKRTYHFDFPFAHRTGDIVIQTKALVIGYDTPLLEPLDLEIRRGQKIAITGKNGIGKTTLIKTLLHQKASLSGTFSVIDTAMIAYYSQIETYDDEETAYRFFRGFYPDVEDKFVYQQLGSYGLDYEKCHRPLKTLSGGEQSKVRLAVLKKQKSNVLILDEPTNHLDDAAKEALIEALNHYQGTLLLVTHETYFYEAVCDDVIELYA
jgi:ATPase subunit of ABC transporter with duplicated ATPase domains